MDKIYTGDELEKGFDYVWGEAPKGTPKYKLGQSVKRFLNFTIDETLRARDKEWLEGKRCLRCGSKKEYDPLCDTCDKCLNEN